MGKTEDSPVPVDELRSCKRRKKAELKFCRGVGCTPEVLSRSHDLVNPSPSTGNAIVEPRSNLYDQSASAPFAGPPAYLDLRFLLDCDAISRDFLFPHFSFHDLLALEKTCKAVRKVVWSKGAWRQQVEEFRSKDEHADRVLSRFSSSRSALNPEHHKRMMSKYFADTSEIYGNLKSGNWRTCRQTFDIGTTCHRAFAIHETGQYAFIQDANDIQVLSLETNKSKRGVVLNVLKTFPIGQMDDYCSLISCHRELVFHATYRQLNAWNWHRGGLNVELIPPKGVDVTGLGLIRALFVQDDCLVVGSNDGGEAHPPTGRALIQLWKVSGQDTASAASPHLNLSLLDEKYERTTKNEVWELFDSIDNLEVRKATSIVLDGDENLIAVGLTFHFHAIDDRFDHRTYGRIRVYDRRKEGRKWLCVRYFDAGASRVRINATQRKAVVGFDKNCFESKPYVQILNIDTGATIKKIMSTEEEITCLYTDWKRFIFTGSRSCLLLWEVVFGVDDAGEKSRIKVTEEFVTGLSGNEGLPSSDKFYDVYFDGYHLIVYTRGLTRASVRVLDCLRLNSIKF